MSDFENSAVIIPEQTAVAVYVNEAGAFVIRSLSPDPHDDDDVIVIQAN